MVSTDPFYKNITSQVNIKIIEKRKVNVSKHLYECSHGEI